MATKATSRPPSSASSSVFKLKEKTLKALATNDVFDKRSSSSAAGRKPGTAASNKSRPPGTPRPQTSSSVLRFGTYSHASFFSRHNPHPARVRHISGLNGAPICAVNDDGCFPSPRRFTLDKLSPAQQRYLLQHRIETAALGLNSSMFPVDTITGVQSYPVRRERAVPQFGLVPVTDSWRDELRAFCGHAGLTQPPAPAPAPQTAAGGKPRQTRYSENTGRLIPPPSRLSSRASSRGGGGGGGGGGFQHISVYPDSETLMMNMLCQILQTQSVQDVQQWLVCAGEHEKTLVLDMIRTGLGGAAEQPGDGHVVAEARSLVGTAASARPPKTAGSVVSVAASGGGGGGVDVLNLDEERAALQSRASSVRSMRPLGSLPKKEEAIVEEQEQEE